MLPVPDFGSPPVECSSSICNRLSTLDIPHEGIVSPSVGIRLRYSPAELVDEYGPQCLHRIYDEVSINRYNINRIEMAVHVQ